MFTHRYKARPEGFRRMLAADHDDVPVATKLIDRLRALGMDAKVTMCDRGFSQSRTWLDAIEGTPFVSPSDLYPGQ